MNSPEDTWLDSLRSGAAILESLEEGNIHGSEYI